MRHAKACFIMASAASPRPVPQIMVSSTSSDLHQHRAALIKMLPRYKFHANAMEDDGAKSDEDVV